MKWAARFAYSGVSLVGDNVAALELALSMRGRRALNRISREIAWRRARAGWRYRVAHWPTELNKSADALSRLCAPAGERPTAPKTPSASQSDALAREEAAKVTTVGLGGKPRVGNDTAQPDRKSGTPSEQAGLPAELVGARRVEAPNLQRLWCV